MRESKSFKATEYGSYAKIRGTIRYGATGHHVTLWKNDRKIAEFSMPANVLDKPQAKQATDEQTRS
jgi:hypothetical protein